MQKIMMFSITGFLENILYFFKMYALRRPNTTPINQELKAKVKKSLLIPQISSPETKPLLDQDLEEEVPEKGSPPSVPTRKPTKMFTPPTQAGEPRQRMLRRSWKSRGLQPKLTPAEQLAKLQALGSDVDAVL